MHNERVWTKTNVSHLHVVTSSQQRSHFLRHVNGRSHTTHILDGKSPFFTPFGIVPLDVFPLRAEAVAEALTERTPCDGDNDDGAKAGRSSGTTRCRRSTPCIDGRVCCSLSSPALCIFFFVSDAIAIHMCVHAVRLVVQLHHAHELFIVGVLDATSVTLGDLFRMTWTHEEDPRHHHPSSEKTISENVRDTKHENTHARHMRGTMWNDRSLSN